MGPDGAMAASLRSPSSDGGAKWPPALGSPGQQGGPQLPTSGSFAFATTPFASGAAQSPELRLADFQRNYAFIGFMLVVCTGGLVFLMGRLEEVLTPFGWAAFFAMPLTGFISLLDVVIVALFRKVCFCVFKQRKYRQAREKANRRNQDVIDFTVRAYEGHVHVSGEDATRLLRKVNRVGEGLFSTCPLSFCSRQIGRACMRHVCVTELRIHSDASSQGMRTDQLRQVNRIVKGWKYYVRREEPEGFRDPEGNDVLLSFYLDKAGRYPAIIDPARNPFAMRGKVEVDKSHPVSYACAVLLAMMSMVLVIIGVTWLISVGEKAIESNVHFYVKGGKELVESFNEYALKVLPKGTFDEMGTKLEESLKERVPEVASEVMKQGQGFGFEILLFLLYLLFWVLEPLPVNHRVSGVFKTYLLQKTLVCLIFATMVSLTLLVLKCKIWHILFLVAFLLNYIPEIGALMCFVIMMPLILLDGHLDVQTRMENAIWFMVLFLAAKFITGNVIEVQLYAKSGGDLMRMHPVVMLALMMLFESLMGITGMFMTVPVMAAVKYYILSSNMPAVVLDPLLTCIEGNEQGPHMAFVEDHNAQYAQLNQDDASDGEEDDSDASDDGGTASD